jgi:hypothetical protein
MRLKPLNEPSCVSVSNPSVSLNLYLSLQEEDSTFIIPYIVEEALEARDSN